MFERFRLRSSGYQLSWCACAALVLLRVAVGWHFLYEGLTKIDSHRKDVQPFSAEGYLGRASGPLAGWFRSQLDDPDGLERLSPAKIPERLEAVLDELDARYQLSQQQLADAAQRRKEIEADALAYLQKEETTQKVEQYKQELDRVRGLEQRDPFLPAQWRGVVELRDELLGPVDAGAQALRQHVMEQLSADQRDGPARRGALGQALGLPFDLAWPKRRIDQINLVTMCGLTLSGILLLVGLFSRLSALWAAAFLGLIYLCNPAPPLGLGNAADPGSYLYVNKELIECLAALVLVTIPTGRWLGLDAFVRGMVTRRLSNLFSRPPTDALPKGFERFAKG